MVVYVVQTGQIYQEVSIRTPEVRQGTTWPWFALLVVGSLLLLFSDSIFSVISVRLA